MNKEERHLLLIQSFTEFVEKHNVAKNKWEKEKEALERTIEELEDWNEALDKEAKKANAACHHVVNRVRIAYGESKEVLLTPEGLDYLLNKVETDGFIRRL